MPYPPMERFDQLIGHRIITDADADVLTDGYSDADSLHTHNAKLDKALASGKMLLGNAQGQASPVTMSGAGSLAPDGTLTLTPGFWGAATSQEFAKENNTTLSDIPGLSVPVQAGKSYLFRAYLFLSCGPGGAKIAAGGTCTASALRYDAMLGNFPLESSLTATLGRKTALGAATAWGNSAVSFGQIVGFLTVQNGGNLTIQFAQAWEDDEESFVLVGSWLRVEEL